MKKASMILMLIVLTSCGSTSKGLFSRWTSQADTTLDLTFSGFGANVAGFFLTDGTICAFDLQISGTEDAGSYTISNDTCATFDGTGTFTNDGNVLTLTDSEGSSTWN